jgi:predicted RNA-binding protein YlqC (UPF0109 family)
MKRSAKDHYNAKPLAELVEYVAKGLVDRPEAVQVASSTDRSTVFLELRVSPEDMGRMIGREGRLANALRVLLRIAAARARRRVVLDITEAR